MNTKIYINDRLALKWKELAMKRFGYGRGSISKAAQKYINGELDDEGFYRYVGKHTWREEQMLDFIKKFKNDHK